MLFLYKEYSYNAENSFFLNNKDEYNLSKVKEIKYYNSTDSIDGVGLSLKLNNLDAITD